MEWEIVTVIIALVGLLTTVTKPILNLTKTITKLNHTCQNLEERMERFENHNHDSHVKIWAHNDKQDEQIINHENRISMLEEPEPDGRIRVQCDSEGICGADRKLFLLCWCSIGTGECHYDRMADRGEGL